VWTTTGSEYEEDWNGQEMHDENDNQEDEYGTNACTPPPHGSSGGMVQHVVDTDETTSELSSGVAMCNEMRRLKVRKKPEQYIRCKDAVRKASSSSSKPNVTGMIQLIHHHYQPFSALIAQSVRPKSRSRVNSQLQTQQSFTLATVNSPQLATKVLRDATTGESSTDDEKTRQVPVVQSVQRKQFVCCVCVCVRR
jgi:hypothetical protein